MKNCFLALLIVFISLPSLAQDSIWYKSHYHEIGVDAAPFITQFLGMSPSVGYTAGYSVMYRYHFNQWALRARVGGHANNSEYLTNDTVQNEGRRSQVYGRVGIERKIDFKKRWQAFYGIDFLAAQYNYYDHYEYSATESQTYKQELTSYGFAPLLGFRFKINNRISLSTETSFAFAFSKGKSERLYMPDEQYNEVTEIEEFQTDFYPPVFLLFTINL